MELKLTGYMILKLIKLGIPFMVITLCYACAPKEPEVVIHPLLIGAKSHEVGEPVDPESKKYNQYAEKEKVTVKQADGYLIATTWNIVNACGKRRANLSVSNDTINLIYKETSEELCMSVAIDEVTYFINNPENKEWVILN